MFWAVLLTTGTAALLAAPPDGPDRPDGGGWMDLKDCPAKHPGPWRRIHGTTA